VRNISIFREAGKLWDGRFMFSERNSIPCVATKVDPGSISNKGKYNESLSYLFGFEIEMLSKKNGGGGCR